MDIDYRKPSSQLVLDLIARDNPDLPFVLTLDNCILGAARTMTPVGIRNTVLSVNPKSASGYIGALNVTYRRLEIATLFPQGRVYLDEWTPSSPILIAEVCDMINRKYGTALQPSDFSTTSITNSTGNKTITVSGTSRAFIGSLTVVRNVGERPVDTLVPATVDAAPRLVADVVPAIEADNLADFRTYGIDFSRFSGLLASFTTLTTFPVNSATRELIAYMGLCVGEDYSLDRPVASRGGFGGARIIRYVLPNINVPEANQDYSAVAVIRLPANNNGWFAGQFLLHYNP